MSYNLHVSTENSSDSVHAITTSPLTYVLPALTPRSKIPKFLRIQLIVILIAIAIVASVYWHTTIQFIETTLAWVTHHLLWGSLIFILLLTLMTILGLPSSILAIGCGFVYYHQLSVFGVIAAILIVWIGSSLGATISFFMSRYLFRNCILRFARNNTKFLSIEAIVQNHGIKLAFIMRLSPILPFVVENYVLGVTSMKTRHYFLGLLAILPGSILWSIVGSSISHIKDISNAESSVSKSPQILVIFIVCAVITVIALIVFMIKAKREFYKIEQQIITEQTQQSEIQLDVYEEPNTEVNNDSIVELSRVTMSNFQTVGIAK